MKWLITLLAATLSWQWILATQSGVDESELDESEANENNVTLVSQTKKTKVCLVLGGGGARGAAHVGVLRVLEREQIPIDCIVGTSMGAIVGGLYASGMSPNELEELLTDTNWDKTLKDATQRTDKSFRRKQDDNNFLVKSRLGLKRGSLTVAKGIFQGQYMDLLLKAKSLPTATITDFDKLRIPFRAIATDIVSGEAVVLNNMNLGTAIRASMSIPTALEPIEHEGLLLVDGGVSNNLPIDVARELGADVVIAVDVSMPLAEKEKLNSAFAIADQLSSILTQNNTKRQLQTLGSADLLIRPELGEIYTTEYYLMPDAIEIGERAMEPLSGRLALLRATDESYRQYQSRVAPIAAPNPIIRAIELDNQSPVDDRVIMNYFDVPLDQALDLEQLEADITQVYGLDLFKSVTYSIHNDAGYSTLQLTVVGNDQGPDYVQLGLNLQDDLDGDSAFNVGIAYTQTSINALNGEWRTELQLGESPRFFSELYQPLDFGNQYFFSALVDLRQFNVGAFSNTRQLAEYRLTQGEVNLASGINFGRWGELRAGLFRSEGEADLRTGDRSLPEGSFSDGGGFLSFSTDTLDNTSFAGSGHFTSTQWTKFSDALGSDFSSEQLSFEGLVAGTWGRHSLLGALDFGYTPGEDAEIQNQYNLGGFVNLSGVNRRELSGQHFALGRAIYLYRLDDARSLFSTPVYLGGSLELGNVWDDKNDFGDSLIPAGSVFLGFDTYVGPLYIGAGFSEGGRRSLYLFLGRTF